MLALLFFAPPTTPKADFDRCVSVMRKAPAYAISVRATTVGGGLTVATTATLAVRSKDWVSINVSTPAEAGHGALEWVCEVHGRRLRAYDARRRAYIQQTFADPLPAASGLVAQFGTMIPDAIQRIITPDQLRKFLDRFSGLSGWRRSAGGDDLKWKYKNRAGTVEFGFSHASGRLTSWKITGPSTTTWKLEYPSVSSMQPLAIPADAVAVDSFRLPPARPVIKDLDCRKAVDACFDAYERAFRFSCTVSVDGVTSQIWRDGGMVEEVGPSGGWKWSKGTLTLWPKSGGVISGPTRLSRVRSYLAQLHVDVEPLALALVNDDNFAGKLFTSDYDVKQVGSVTLAGEPLTLLQLTGPAVSIDLSEDTRGFIRRIDSLAFDRFGRRMSETIRDIAYGALGTPTAPPPGRALPLPKLLPPPKLPPGMIEH